MPSKIKLPRYPASARVILCAAPRLAAQGGEERHTRKWRTLCTITFRLLSRPPSSTLPPRPPLAPPQLAASPPPDRPPPALAAAPPPSAAPAAPPPLPTRPAPRHPLALCLAAASAAIAHIHCPHPSIHRRPRPSPYAFSAALESDRCHSGATCISVYALSCGFMHVARARAPMPYRVTVRAWKRHRTLYTTSIHNDQRTA